MGKRKRGTITTTGSSLDAAFNIQSDLLESIKQKQCLRPLDENSKEDLVDHEDQSPGKPIEEPNRSKRERMSLVELKKVAPLPELVEIHDTHAPDPIFLATLKAYPGSVPIPATWQGREFRSKFAISKPYKLPKNVYETGIVQQRDVFEGKDKPSDKQVAKDRLIPKLGTLDLDLHKLKQAFFKNQTKPRLYPLGQVFTDKLEQTHDFSEYRPGELSARLKDALGIKDNQEPPWAPLVAKYGYPEVYGQLSSGSEPIKVKHWGELDAQ